MPKKNWGLIGYFGGWFLYFALFWSKALGFDPAGNLVAYHVNIWGDWAAHFTMATSQAYRQLWLTDSPFLIQSRFSYPFIADLISAIFLKLGWPLIPAFVIPSFLFSCLMIIGLYVFYKVVFKSRLIAVIASLIFLLNGGVGVYYFAQDVLQSPQPLHTLINPPHEYTRLDQQHLKWISVIDSMMIPQRAFALGFPLTLIALALIYWAIWSSDPGRQSESQLTRKSWLALITAGVILGCLPLIHTHSFLAAGIILAGWSVTHVYWSWRTDRQWSWWRLKPWLTVASLATIIAWPQLQTFFWGTVNDFIQWYPGWLATEFKMNWFTFWFKNWGVTPILAGLGWLVVRSPNSSGTPPHHPKYLFWLFLPFFLIFLLANLWLFQPFSWDNTKLIVWASLGFSGLAGYYLVQLWRTPGLRRWLAGLILAGTIASGTLDAYWIQRVDLHYWVMYSAEELSLADWTKNQTEADSIWITSDKHNHWLFNLTGRQTLMAYRGWLWTQGYNYQPVEAELATFFADPTASGLVSRYGVDYIVLGPEEILNWRAQPLVFDQHFKLIKQTENYRIYQVP